MTHQEFLTAAIQDARQAYQSYQSMRSEELLHLQAVRQVGQDNATTPEDLVYNGGRLALIAAILKHRNADGRT